MQGSSQKRVIDAYALQSGQIVAMADAAGGDKAFFRVLGGKLGEFLKINAVHRSPCYALLW